MKKIATILALTLSVVGLSACTQADEKIEFNRYWNDNAQVSENVSERLEYSVEFKASTSSYVESYKINYTDGTYVTELTTRDDGTYLYKTELALNVTYTCGSESVTMQDYVKTEVLFNDVTNALKPISSTKEMLSHSPTNVSAASKLEDCYHKYHYTQETTYKADNSATYKLTDHTNEDPSKATTTKDFSTADEKYSYLDNDQLLFGLRAISPSVTSAIVLSYGAAYDAVQQIKLDFSSATGAEFEYTKNGVAFKGDISYRPVTLALNSNNPGSTQTAWIATPSTTGMNINHNVMLRYEAPVYYSLGTLVYSLKSVTYDNGLQ